MERYIKYTKCIYINTIMKTKEKESQREQTILLILKRNVHNFLRNTESLQDITSQNVLIVFVAVQYSIF